MKNRHNKRIGLLHLGKKEKSGDQILKKLQQHNIDVQEIVILDEFDKLGSLLQVDVVIVNIGKTDFDYSDFLSSLFENEFKIIINEAGLTNKLIGQERQSWERHLLNKIDSSYKLLPTNKYNSKPYQDVFNLKEYGIKETWILVASIGGPESVQRFLSSFNGSEPILFILMQHIDKHFLTSMTSQLNKYCNLSVSIPVSGVKLSVGECIVHPTEEFLYFCKDGRIELKPLTNKSKFSPCIDDCCERLVGNIKNINMAIFSGMSSDGVEGAKFVKESGGKIITQNEDSCVLSSIISGVKTNIGIDFYGRPEKMAEYIIESIKITI